MENKGHEVVETQLLRSQIAALEQLIEVYEKSVLEKMGELYEEIAKRKEAEEALRASEARYRSVIEDQTELICRYRPDGSLSFVNSAYARYYGKSQEELINRGFVPHIPETDLLMIKEVTADITQENPVVNFEHRIMTPDNEVCWQHWTYRGIYAADGRLVEYQAVGRDVSDRKQVEELYRTLVERSIAAVFIVQDGKFRFINPSTVDFTGYSAEEIIGKPADAAVYPKEREMVKEKGRAMLRGEYPTPYEFRIVTKQGELRWIMQAVFPIQFEGKQAILGNAIDITELKHAEEKQRRSLEKLRQIIGAIIQAMAVSIETRDPYTAGHQRRVSDLARAIATEMGLSKKQIDGVRMASTIHDIGKISVPAEILSKPKKLNDSEFSLVKAHSQAGYDILKDIEFPWPIARIILEHHERMDGSGYPNGLTGNNLLIESRVLAVADTVEAIASHRPYRPGMGINYALGEILNYKGILYDKEVVDACLRVFHEKGYKFET